MPSRPANFDLTPDLDTSLIREGLGALVQILIEIEISAVIAAAPHERSAHRRTQRNGYRRRILTTSVGAITCYIPKLRRGSYYPSFLEQFDQHEELLLDSLRHMLEQGVSLPAFQSIVNAIGLEVAGVDLLADGVERFYDFTHRLRHTYDGYSSAEDEHTLAISTQQMSAFIANRAFRLPQSILITDSDAMLDESLYLLLRVRQALSESTDAIALAA